MNWELLPELGAGGAYCLNGGRYMLVELPTSELPAYADEFWYELELKGITPVLAHPERYRQLHENKDLLLLWRRRGMLMQCNSGSFTGMFGKSVCENAKALLANGLVDLAIGSILSRSRQNYLVWGGGYMDASEKGLGGKYLAVRGPYSAEKLEAEGYPRCNVYGDPALLLPLVYTPKSISASQSEHQVRRHHELSQRVYKHKTVFSVRTGNL